MDTGHVVHMKWLHTSERISKHASQLSRIYIYIYIYIYTYICWTAATFRNYKDLIFTAQLHNCLEFKTTRMEHTFKHTIEESRVRNQAPYESLLRLEALLTDVQSGKTYQYIICNYYENMLLTLRLKSYTFCLRLKNDPSVLNKRKCIVELGCSKSQPPRPLLSQPSHRDGWGRDSMPHSTRANNLRAHRVRRSPCLINQPDMRLDMRPIKTISRCQSKPFICTPNHHSAVSVTIPALAARRMSHPAPFFLKYPLEHTSVRWRTILRPIDCRTQCKQNI